MYLGVQIFSHLGRTEQKLDKLLNQQELMLQHMGMTRAGFEELPDDIQPPVKSYLELVKLNELLADENNRVLGVCVTTIATVIVFIGLKIQFMCLKIQYM